MAVLQRNSNGVLSRGTDGVIVRAIAGASCCCDGLMFTPSRYCSDGTLVRAINPGTGLEGDVGTFACDVVTGYWLYGVDCVYLDPADCRAAQANDNQIISPPTFDSCEECEDLTLP
jgi:hypothetical protein